MTEKRLLKVALAILVVAAILAGTYVRRGSAQRTAESQLIDDVAAAMGGKERLMGVRSLVVEGEGRQGDPTP
jgi:hypothetical protein